ncbi:uncharacterized protein [Dysidea avara]|uniref:uncharacterized protein n=1 Tax=Dysidea avara TaxID=196820 RepID=UPI0033170732
MLKYRCLLTLLIPCAFCLLDKNEERHDPSSNTPSSCSNVEDVGSEVFPGMRPDCLYFSADMITFTITGVVEFNSSIMNDEYSGSCGVTGCETNHITLQYFYGTHFTFSAVFKMSPSASECSDDIWSMTQFSHQNSTENKTYDYKVKSVAATNGTSFHCNELSFTSTSGDAKVTLHNTSIQAFFLAGTTLSDRVAKCGKVYDYDYLTYVISGGMGTSILLAVLAICVSCLSKRWKYGRYNLLDT